MTTATATTEDDTSSSSFQDALGILKRIPATLITIVVVLGVGISTQALWKSATEMGLTERWGFGLPAFQEGQWYTVFVGAAISPEPWMYALILATFAIGAGYLEYRFGAWRMLLAVIGTHIGAVLLVATMFWALSGVDVAWIQQLSKVRDVGLSNGGFGALGAASAAMAPLWRRRVRLIGSLYVIAMILYAGEIWDFTHAAALFIGLAIGPLVVGRPYEKIDWHLGRQEIRDLAGIIVAFGAVHHLLTRLWPGEGGILSFGVPEDTSEISLLTQLGFTIISLTLSYALHRGRRAARIIILIITIGGAALIAIGIPNLHPSQWLDLFLDLVLIAILFIWRRHFMVRGDRRTRRRTYRRILFLGLGVAAFNVVAIMALRNSFTPTPTLGTAIGESVLRIFGLSNGETEPTTTAARLLVSSIGVIWFIAVAIAFAAIMLNSRAAATDPTKKERFIQLQTDTTGMTDVGYMARWDGLAYWVSDAERVAIAFKQIGGTAIVLSDAVGRPEDVREDMHEFFDYCRSHGLRPTFFSVTAEFRDLLETFGYRSIQVAEDTVIRLPELEFKGKAWQDVRSAINRANREGVTMTAVRMHDAPRGLKDQLGTIAAQWVGDKSLPEMGFTLGGLKEADDPNVVMHLAVHEDGTVHGMTSWMPVYRDGDVVGWTIDIMQRRLDDGVMSGVMEFLIAQTAMEFKEQGYEFISLSCAPLSYSAETGSPLERMLDILADKMEPYYGFTSLERFKAKFKPQHVPMYLAYEDEAQLPGISVAILRAYLPDAKATDLIRAAVQKDD
ncbi:bifunctional lysylphosphatidylglycerol flippase/synthetase MprF [Demequina aurantiaca]|uniref:bifunctional lysylphosphatidylglycerol flippase/synthetase MprF n=1 Tax=Demequina aurantiaca TaxID=676200 RepID=UPI00078656AB|nr:DUF2156 domain-containing protein [Demequina aurantiaca]